MLHPIRICAGLAVAALVVSRAGAQYVEGFESYPASAGGTTFTPGGQVNSGGWFQWDLVFNEDTKCYTGGPVAPHGGAKYLATQVGSDTTRSFTTYTSGHWVVRTWTYVPAAMTNVHWFVVMNDYNHNGPYYWGTQVAFDPMTVSVLADAGIGLTTCTSQYGITLPLVFDAWKELVIDVDVGADVARIYYDGAALGEPFTWSQGPFGTNGGITLPCPPPSYAVKAIAAFDLYSTPNVVGSRMYWDDLSITPFLGPPVVYCTPPGSTMNGCIPTITASGSPNVAHSNPCSITVSNVEGQRSGIVFYGLASTSTPWCTLGGNSLLCVKSPTMRTGAQASGGTAGACDGTLVLDWNAFQLAHPSALGAPWVVGAKAYVQGWFRDPPACKTTFLSQGVELTYFP
jgi:hypothetical protein